MMEFSTFWIWLLKFICTYVIELELEIIVLEEEEPWIVTTRARVCARSDNMQDLPVDWNWKTFR